MIEYMNTTEEGINDGSGQNTTSEILSAVDIERLFDNMKVGTELVEYVVKMVNNIYDIINRSRCPDAYLPRRTSVHLPRYLRVL